MSDKPVTVYFDSQIFSLQTYGGISRYFSEIIPRLPDFNILPVMTMKYSSNEYLDKLPPEFRVRKIYSKSKGVNLLIYLTNFINDYNSFRKSDPDIIHFTYFSKAKVNPGKIPSIVTLYDTIPVNGLLFDRKPYLFGADKLIAISEATKKSYISEFGLDPGIIKVIHLASSLPVTEICPPGLPGKYLLFVGNRSGYKNFSVVEDAFNGIKSSYPNLYLVCAGGERPETSQMGDRIIHFPVSGDKELSGFYSHAQAFIFPSLKEGFGIPLLEAFGAGCPVIASDIEVFHEVAGNACLYFSPENTSDLIRKIRSVADNPALKHRLLQYGRNRSKIFSWEKTASRTAEIYRFLIT